MRKLLRLELRMEAQDEKPARWEACARCGRHNRLVAWTAPNGAIVYLQPNHPCDDVISELRS